MVLRHPATRGLVGFFLPTMEDCIGETAKGLSLPGLSVRFWGKERDIECISLVNLLSHLSLSTCD